MITMNAAQLREVQMTELELLKEARRICEKHHIPYCVIAGTLLGAVRHRGFIPWDDDADIAMLRPDYERFRSVCRTELDPSKYVFQDDRNTRGYRWGYGKLRRRDTVFLREYQEEMPYFQGIFIDIFPLDEVPAGYPLRAAENAACFVIRKFLWARVGKKADRNPVKRMVYRIMDRVPEDAIRARYHGMIRRAEKRRAGYDAEETRSGGRIRERWVRILMYPAPNLEYGYRRKWYAERSEWTFEGETFQGIRDADAYLTFKFGQYMELPPEDKRKLHPVSRLLLLSDTGKGGNTADNGSGSTS